MTESKFILRYIPKFEEDLNEIVDYITFTLYNQASAKNLTEKIEIAILERLNYPLAFEPYQSSKKRKNPYYRIYVQNFVVYYVVIENVMEVRRILYKGRDSGRIIK